jgi:Protein YTP1-like, C-terminal
LGWAWNRTPARRSHSYKIPSTEAVESFVIFFYGATNVWMERFGAVPGSPFTTKQIQHISIAAMFWFAGMLGMALESGTFRRWLSSPARSAVKREQPITPPPSYAGSFNPFPALVIGVTGAAMSAHHQTYLFQVCSGPYELSLGA